MKAVLAALVILVTAASISHAAPEGASQQRVGKVSRLTSKRSFSYGKYSSVLNNLINYATKLGVTDEQRLKLNALRKDYVFDMAKDENEAAAIRADVTAKVSDPSFDPAAVKKALKKATSLDEKSTEKYVDGLVALRDIIGKENYAKINDSKFGSGQNLVQMRQRNTSQFNRDVQLNDLKENAPVSTESTGSQKTEPAAPKE